MRHFVQLKDDVVFSFHSSSTEVDIPGDNIIQVEEDGEKYMGKKYENGNFVDAPTIKYAILENNVVVGFKTTTFSSEVDGPIVDADVKIMATWNGSSFTNPEPIAPIVITPVEVIPAPMHQEPIPEIPEE
jgi:hypothetical protein